MKMKKLTLFTATIIVCTSIQCSAQSKLKRGIDTKKLIQAGAEMYAAKTLSDDDIAKLSREAVSYMDANNQIAEEGGEAGEASEYAARLRRLTENITEVNGMPVNFKVYLTSDINAFACGDGSIRVFSALMDIMDDDELMGIIGHEIGHVVNTDVKDAMQKAYKESALKNAAGAFSETISKINDSQLGDMVSAFNGAQFSQKQEYEADDYGYRFAIDNGFSPYSMSNSLYKLVELSNGEKASKVQQMFSSHPDSEKRAGRMKEMADKYVAEHGE